MILNNTPSIILHLPQSISSMDFDTTECESEMLMLIMQIQPIFLLIFGFAANLCSFIVLIQPRLRRRPTFSYLAFLSLSNAFLSLIHAFFTIIGVHFGYTLEDLPLFFFCRLLNRFSIDFLTHFSLYTLTAVDLDRVRAVTSKTNTQRRYETSTSIRPKGCTPAFIRVCLIEFSFVCVLFFLDLHWLTSYGYTTIKPYLNDTIHQTICTIGDLNPYSPFYKHYLMSILPITELILFGIVPFIISLFATIIILRHVSIKYTYLNSQNQHIKQSRRRMELHLSILLISLNCVFILFTTPHNIFNVYLGRLYDKLDTKDETEGELCSIAIIQKSLDLLQQCYFMSTFFLYILTNKRFREEFYRLFKCFIYIFQRNPTTNNAHIQRTIHHNQIYDHNNQNDDQHNLNGNTLVLPSTRQSVGSHLSIADGSEEDEPI